MNAIEIRTFRRDTDLAGLAELFGASRGSVLSPEEVLNQVRWPGFDISRDRFVALRGGWIAATGMVYPQSPRRFFVTLTTHPEVRRQGIGRKLLEFLSEEVRRRGGEQATCSIEAGNRGAQAFAGACGFEQAGESRFFDAPAEAVWPAPELPEGFNLRSVAELGSVQPFVDACNACYQDMWGHRENLEPLTVERVTERQALYPNILRPAGMFVLFSPQGQPVGVTRADREGEGDQELRVIDAPGVAPAYRRLGLQRAIVQQAAAWLRQNGSGPYQIQTWGDFPEAVALYEALGFRLDESSHEVEFVRYLGEIAASKPKES